MSTTRLAGSRATRAESPHATALNSLGPLPRRRRGGWWVVLLAGGVAVALLVAWGSDRWPGRRTELGDRFQTHAVQRGPLEITVVEQGNLESTSNVDIRCEVEGGRVGSGGGSGPGTQIIWLFKEGEFVSKGDKIVELEPSGLNQQEIEQQIAFETARQALITAKNTHVAAKIAVDEYLHGTFPKDLELVDAEITVAKENVRRAEEYAAYSERLFQKGFVTQVTLEADQFAVENAKLTLKAAQTKKTTLVDYSKKKMVADLESQRDSAEAAMKAAEAKFSLEESKLKQIRDQLAKCTIYAPADGMVIYASERDRRGRSEAAEIKEGALVRLRQVIIQLPDLSRMQVKAKVHESMIERVKKGQQVTIKVDALPNLTLHGEVQGINNQPEPGSWFSSNVKEYAVFVSIDERVENLKPGMTAEVEVEIDRLDDVLTVPVQAVVQKGEQDYCYVAGDSGIEERPVVLGDSNDVLIEIKDGLNEAERVILHPRSVVPEARERGASAEQKKNGLAASFPKRERTDEPPVSGEKKGGNKKNSGSR